MRGIFPTPVFIAGLLVAALIIVFGPFHNKMAFVFLVALFTVLVVALYEESKTARTQIDRIRETRMTDEYRRARAAEILQAESGISEDEAAAMVAAIEADQFAEHSPQEIARIAIATRATRDDT